MAACVYIYIIHSLINVFLPSVAIDIYISFWDYSNFTLGLSVTHFVCMLYTIIPVFEKCIVQKALLKYIFVEHEIVSKFKVSQVAVNFGNRCYIATNCLFIRPIVAMISSFFRQ